MLQELFRIPILDWPVYGYGLMLVLGVFAAIELGRYLANRIGLNGETFVMIGLVAIASGVVGARISHVLENLSAYTRPELGLLGNLRNAVNLSSGGLTFYGGFLAALPSALLYAKWRGVPLRPGLDVVAPCIMVALAIGRVGCFLNGCCWGQVCDPQRVAWAASFPYGSPPHQSHWDQGLLEVPPALLERYQRRDGREVELPRPPEEVFADPELEPLARQSRSLPVHPTQLYSTINAGLIAAACVAFMSLPHAAGQVFALMLLLKGVSRFVIELVRTEPAVALGMSFSMWVSLFVIAGGVAFWLWCGLRWQPPYVTGRPAGTAPPTT